MCVGAQDEHDHVMCVCPSSERSRGVSNSSRVTWYVRAGHGHVVFSSSWVYSRGAAGGTAVSSCEQL